MGIADLPTLANRPRASLQKPMPRAVMKPLARKAKEDKHAAFRKAVWARDKGKSRASGKPLDKSGADYARVGEVHHVIPRSLAPERVFDVSNGLLLSRSEHALAETRCPNDPAHFLLDIVGPDDRGKPQAFIWRDIHGKQLRRKQG